jgi:hypothetical protein
MKTKIAFISLLVIFITFATYFVIKFANKMQKQIDNLNTLAITAEESPMSTYGKTYREEVYYLLSDIPIKHKDIVYAQAIIESGNFKSHSFILRNNIFGMKEVMGTRPTTQIGGSGGYGIYYTLEDCIIDYWIWQYLYCRDLNEKEYLEYLQRNYAEDTEYSDKIKKIVKKHETN